MADGGVSDIDPVTAQTLEPDQPNERPDALEAGPAMAPPPSQSAIRSAYVAHLSHVDTGAGIAHDLLAGSMRSAYVSHLSQADAGAGGAHDLPAAGMLKAIYAERSAAGAAPAGKRATAVSPKRKAPKKKAKARATPVRRRKVKTVASAGKRRGKRSRR